MRKVLEEHHARIEAEMAVLRRLITAPACPGNDLAEARLWLSLADFDRTRYLIETVYPALGSGTGRAAAVGDLGRSGLDERARSSAHVNRWSPQAIRADWPGFAADSAMLLATMAARIERERAILYPLLQER